MQAINQNECQKAEIHEHNHSNSGDYKLLSKLVESQKNEIIFLQKLVNKKTSRILKIEDELISLVKKCKECPTKKDYEI